MGLFPRTLLVTLVLASSSAGGLGCDSCRGKSSSAGGAVDASSGSENAADEGAGAAPGAPGATGELPSESRGRFRDASPQVEADRDGGVDPACVGGKSDLALATAVVDPRCAIGRVRASELRARLEHDGGPLAPLRQEAKLLDDGRIVHRLVNTGPAPLTLPLIFSATLPAFLVMAESEGQTLYELATPRFEVPPAKGRAHFARIVLEPGGAAVATITLDPAVTGVVARRGGERADAGATLPKGHYVLRIGELLTDVDAGAPALVPFDVR